MANFARSFEPRRTMTGAEIRRLLDVTGEHAAIWDFRDHVMFSLMLATGIRCCEVRALRWSDVVKIDEGKAKRIVTLRKVKGGTRGRPRAELEVRVPKPVGLKIEALRREMRKRGYSTAASEPVFQSNRRTAISKRAIQKRFVEWQEWAKFDRQFVLHELRHTAIMMAYEASGHDIEATRRFARHRDIKTTQEYLHASDDTMDQISRGIAAHLIA